jgi:hypothetical protein
MRGAIHHKDKSMAENTFENTPPAGGNEMMGEGGGGEPVRCVHIYAMPDGTYGVKVASEPPPEGLQTVASMEELIPMLEQGLSEQEAPQDDAMEAAKAGYARRATARN